MWPSFTKQLGLQMQRVNISAQKIDNSQLEKLSMVIAFYSVDDKDRKSCFIEEIFLLVDISIDIASEMPFLTLSNV